MPDAVKAEESGIVFEDEEFNKTWFLGIYYVAEDVPKWITNYAELCPKHRCFQHTEREMR